MSEEIKNLEGVLTFNGRPVMTPSRAKEVLQGMGLDCFKTDFLYLQYHKLIKLAVEPGGQPDAAALNGNFSADQLQAIALWMQDPEGVTNA